jgi:hypothetical protein
MADSTFLPKRILVLAIILPLAALVGYLLASPADFDSIALVGLLISTLLLPFLLKWHQAIVILTWNATVSVFFLPGQPSLWICLSLLGFGIAVLTRGLAKEEAFTFIGPIVWPLLLLALVVFVTAQARGGIGLRGFGGAAYGGKRYVFVLAAILGYFVITSHRIPLQSVRFLAGGYFASAITAAMSNIIYLLGPAFYFLYMVFPVDWAFSQALADVAGFARLIGFAFAGPAVVNTMLLLYGVRGVFSFSHPFRFGFFLIFFGLTLLGGFRSSIVTTGILFVILFCMEGLHRTKLMVFFSVALIAVGSLLIPFGKDLPMSVQRSLSFLPLDLDPVAKFDARISTEWRVEMWKIAALDIPKYLLLGKGCSLDPSELYLLHHATEQGLFKSYEEALFIGSYHNGPLTLLIEFGLFGALAFLWFLYTSGRVLCRYYLRGDVNLKGINTFLFGYFLMRVIFFFAFYGQFAEDIYLFTGIVGLAVAINGNFKKPVPASVSSQAISQGETSLEIPQPAG